VLEIEAAALGMEDVAAAYEACRTDSVAISPEHSRGFHAFCRRLEAMPAASRPRLVKGHVTGPVTLAMSLETDYEARAAIYEPELARLVAQVVGLKARFQEEAFARAAPGLPTLIFFDEPSLGSIGSAVLNLDATLAVELLSIAARACQGLPGIHCCGETDLGLVAEAGVKVLNFDAFDYLDSVVAAGRQVRAFVEGGGMLAIGLVPSFLPHPEKVAEETVESLWARLLEVVDTLASTGLDRELLARRAFLTPSCGTGGMRPDLARRSLELTAQLAAKAREHFLGA
jgi:methionine synthase II (cobalamin-independent)